MPSELHPRPGFTSGNIVGLPSGGLQVNCGNIPVEHHDNLVCPRVMMISTPNLISTTFAKYLSQKGKTLLHVNCQVSIIQLYRQAN